jgi:hypothetical protein
MTKCRRCHRPLIREPYRSNGIGKICAQKEIDGARQNNSDSDIIVPYDGGDVWIERIEPERHTTSSIRTNVQRREYRHSPTGFNFGYGGSGPADFALNVLLMFADKETANNLYQNFKFEFVSFAPEDKLVIKKQDILNFINNAKNI